MPISLNAPGQTGRCLCLLISAVWAFAAAGSAGAAEAKPYGLSRRVAAGRFNLPSVPVSASGLMVRDAFPHLRFCQPLQIVSDGSKFYVLEKPGRIHVFRQDRQVAETSLFLDLSSRTADPPYSEAGALGMALHPQFADEGSPHRGEFFVWYVAQGAGGHYNRLSRFRASPEHDRADPTTEVVLIEQVDERERAHNGGGLAFGPDGFLYVSVGDEGTQAGVEDGFGNAQRIDRNLFSGVLRIDVDQIGGNVSHPPPRQPQRGRTANYFIPSDNPFVGVPGALEEFWAIGLRSPHRMSFDRETGTLWLGDVGSDRWEEINIVRRGSNHAWSYREGSHRRSAAHLGGVKPSPYFGVETPPILEYPHAQNNNCVIGGYVYRGRQFPELRGRYIYGDNGSGRVFALEFDGDRAVSNTLLVEVPHVGGSGIFSLGEDQDGELYVLIGGRPGVRNGRILQLARVPEDQRALPPEKLSETGLFTDLARLTPRPGLIPFTVNSPLWSDGAAKVRWIAVPGDGTASDPHADRIGFQPTGAFRFPAGTVLVKHFEWNVGQRDPRAVRRLETRVLVVTENDQVFGFTYVWNDAQDEAFLIDERLEQEITVTTADGQTRRRTWVYPSRNDCLRCHNANAGFVLGVNARQLNGEYSFGETGVRDNQLRAWNHIGLFHPALDEADIDSLPRLTPVDAAGVRPADRVRSYLDANCSHCHQPGGVHYVPFDARFDTPLAQQHLVNSLLLPGDPGRSKLLQRVASRESAVQMPPLATSQVDTAAVAAIEEWIHSLVPFSVKGPLYLMSLAVPAMFFAVAVWAARRAGLPGAGRNPMLAGLAAGLLLWTAAALLLSGGPMLESRLLYIPRYWFPAAAVVAAGLGLLGVRRYRSLIAASPPEFWVVPQVFRATACALFVLTAEAVLPLEYGTAARLETGIGISAVGVSLLALLRRCPASVLAMWNLAGLASAAYFCRVTIHTSPFAMHHAPLATAAIAAAPWLVLLHVYALLQLAGILRQPVGDTCRRSLQPLGFEAHSAESAAVPGSRS